MPSIWGIIIAIVVGSMVLAFLRKSAKGSTAQRNEAKAQAFARFKQAADKRVEAQRQEKPFVIMNLGSVKAPIKPHELETIAMIMAFAVKHANMKRQDALEYSILTFVLSKAGGQTDKQSAEETIQSAFRWEMDNANRVGLAESMMYKLECHADLVVYFDNGKKNAAVGH